jgi:hypothetical protein
MRKVHRLLPIAVCLPINAAVAKSSNPRTPHLDALADASFYPLYCHGPLVTGSGASPKTAFKWASKGVALPVPALANLHELTVPLAVLSSRTMATCFRGLSTKVVVTSGTVCKDWRAPPPEEQ